MISTSFKTYTFGFTFCVIYVWIQDVSFEFYMSYVAVSCF